MQECKTYFYIEKFMDKLDTNPYLLGLKMVWLCGGRFNKGNLKIIFLLVITM